MQEQLQQLKKQIADIHPPSQHDPADIQSFKKNCIVALMAGGESSRFQSVPDADKSNKNSYRLPNGDTMIEMTIRMYRDAGIKNFVALVYHKAETIEEILGDGSALGVNISYSYDPDHPVGKDGAILNAFQNGSIKNTQHVIVHNPDDVIIREQNIFVDTVIRGHLDTIKNNAIATVVVVEETPYEFSGMEIQNNMVKEIEMYPMVPIPTHIGVTVFTPDALAYFPEYFDLKEKADFEKVLFPVWAKKKKLRAVTIPTGNWIAVNTLKAYKKFCEYLEG